MGGYISKNTPSSPVGFVIDFSHYFKTKEKKKEPRVPRQSLFETINVHRTNGIVDIIRNKKDKK